MILLSLKNKVNFRSHNNIKSSFNSGYFNNYSKVSLVVITVLNNTNDMVLSCSSSKQSALRNCSAAMLKFNIKITF